MENVDEVRRMFVRRKPRGVKITPLIAEYMVNYRDTELAITDRDTTNVVRFKPKERFKRNQVMIDKVDDFQDINFWGSHNTIEPEQSIESAIRKIKRRARKR